MAQGMTTSGVASTEDREEVIKLQFALTAFLAAVTTASTDVATGCEEREIELQRLRDYKKVMDAHVRADNLTSTPDKATKSPEVVEALRQRIADEIAAVCDLHKYKDDKCTTEEKERVRLALKPYLEAIGPDHPAMASLASSSDEPTFSFTAG